MGHEGGKALMWVMGLGEARKEADKQSRAAWVVQRAAWLEHSTDANLWHLCKCFGHERGLDRNTRAIVALLHQASDPRISF